MEVLLLLVDPQETQGCNNHLTCLLPPCTWLACAAKNSPRAIMPPYSFLLPSDLQLLYGSLPPGLKGHQLL